jgi:hypothetical protein
VKTILSGASAAHAWVVLCIAIVGAIVLTGMSKTVPTALWGLIAALTGGALGVTAPVAPTPTGGQA